VEIKISARHGHLSEATQSRIEAKLEKLSRFYERLTAIEVTVDLEHRDAPSVDVKASAAHVKDFVATGRSGELMASIDVAIAKLEQQLRKHKEKVRDHHRTQARRQPGTSGRPGRAS
jgi:putative sigma-54 modulation protein